MRAHSLRYLCAAPVIAASLAISATLPALPAAALPRYDFEVPWSTAGVSALAIAPDGALWVGGQVGLVNFDGRDVVTHDSRNTPVLAKAGAVGRVGIHERARWLRGQVAIVSAEGMGTEVRVTVPIAPAGATS